jgi:hypothetical protein
MDIVRNEYVRRRCGSEDWGKNGRKYVEVV